MAIIHKTLSVVLILILSLYLSSSASSSDAPTAYDLLEDHGLPRGILPEGVESYLLRSDGSFDAYLAGECEVEVRRGDRVYLLKYKRKIRGVLDSGSITKLHGVSVKAVPLLWLRVDEVVRTDKGVVRFEAGFGLLRADFPLAELEECPRCRHGFDRIILDS